jgi:hypothetical protein
MTDCYRHVILNEVKDLCFALPEAVRRPSKARIKFKNPAGDDNFTDAP